MEEATNKYYTIEDCKELIQAVNSLQLLYCDKITKFWQQLFLGCTGYVALAVPIAVKVEIPASAQRLLLFSVVVAILAALALIYPLAKGIMNIKAIHEEGRHMLIKYFHQKDSAPPYCTRGIVICILRLLSCLLAYWHCFAWRFTFQFENSHLKTNKKGKP